MVIMDRGWCSVICELLLAERCQWVREKIRELSHHTHAIVGMICTSLLGLCSNGLSIVPSSG